MKVNFGIALGAAALLAACSSTKQETRTAQKEPVQTGQTQQGSIEGTQGTAGGTAQGTMTAQGQTTTSSAPGTASGSSTGTATASTPSGSTSTSTHGNDRSGQANTRTSTAGQKGTVSGSGTTYGQSGTSGSSGTGSPGTYGGLGSTYGQSGAGSTSGTGSTYGQSGTTDTSGSVSSTPQSDTSVGTSGSRSGSMDRQSGVDLKVANGRVAKVDEDGKSITLNARGAGSLTLTVDDNTQIIDQTGSTSAKLSSIREGTQVRASFDPASNHAERIEVMGKSKRMKRGSSSGTSDSMKTQAPSPDTAKSPPQGTTGSSNPPDQK